MMCGFPYLRAQRIAGLVVNLTGHRRLTLAPGGKAQSSSRMRGPKMLRQGVPGHSFQLGVLMCRHHIRTVGSYSFASFNSQLKSFLSSLTPPRLPSPFPPLGLLHTYSILIIFNYNMDSSIIKYVICTTQFIHIFIYSVIHS